MPRAWKTIDSVATDEGDLVLSRLGEDEWVITIDRRVLMSSRLHRSEVALAELACAPLAKRPAPRVLIAGLGMGYTLRAALDVLPAGAVVVTAELNPVVVRWNRGPLAALSRNALDDPRVDLRVADVGDLIARAATGRRSERYDAIVLDLYEGPYARRDGAEDRLFGPRGLELARCALRAGGCFAVWSEEPAADFERRLRRAGFRVECQRPARKGPRHVVYLAWPAGARR